MSAKGEGAFNVDAGPQASSLRHAGPSRIRGGRRDGRLCTSARWGHLGWPQVGEFGWPPGPGPAQPAMRDDSRLAPLHGQPDRNDWIRHNHNMRQAPSDSGGITPFCGWEPPRGRAWLFLDRPTRRRRPVSRRARHLRSDSSGLDAAPINACDQLRPSSLLMSMIAAKYSLFSTSSLTPLM